MTAQDFYTFTAPQAGTYRFRTDSAEPGADTAIVLRSFCRYDDLGAELACNDDVSPQNDLSDVSIDLAARETVYVIVGGVQNAAFPKGSFRGRYQLIATRRRGTLPAVHQRLDPVMLLRFPNARPTI